MSERQLLSGGILLIDKPEDWTSFDVVSKMRRLLAIRKIGHIGTLDPFAVGLLPVCVGRATRMVRFMDYYDKIYRVTVVFGRSTDTLDLTGTTVSQHQLTADERDQLIKTDYQLLRDAVSSLTKMTVQTPPLYSAVKINGRRSYEYARSGQTVERPERSIRVYRADVDSITLNDSLKTTLTIHCSKGTYIRSLCESLGEMLGWGAFAESLQRIACGPYRLDHAITLDELGSMLKGFDTAEARLKALQNENHLLPIETALTDCPAFSLSETEALGLVHGQPVFVQTEYDGERIGFYYKQQLIAVGRFEKESPGLGRIRTERVLIDHADLYR